MSQHDRLALELEEIEVTPELLRAGVRELGKWSKEWDFDEHIILAIF